MKKEERDITMRINNGFKVQESFTVDTLQAVLDSFIIFNISDYYSQPSNNLQQKKEKEKFFFIPL